jgi:hypothetical protein
LKKAVVLTLFAAFFALPLSVQAGTAKIPYTPEVLEKSLAKGCAVLLEFGASW